MKNFYVAGVLFAMTLVSCQEDNSLFNEPVPIRAYDTDARIMEQFVEIDKATGTICSILIRRSQPPIML